MTVYNGNTVSYISGSNPNWYVRLTVTDGGSSTGATTAVYYTYEVVFAGAISDSSVSITWTDPWGSGTTTFPVSLGGAGSVVWGGNPNTASAPIQYGGGNTLHFQVSVSGVGSANSGPSSLSIDYPLPARLPSPPDPPTVHYDGLTSTAIHVYLSAPANNNGAAVDAYETYLLTNNAWPFSGGHVVASASASSLSASGLTRTASYYFTGRAHNATGWSFWAPMGVATTLTTAPDAPTAPTVSGIAPLSAVVSWSPPASGGSPITGYDVQVARDSGFTVGMATVTDDASPTALADLIPGTDHWVRVRAKNAIGAGAWSPATKFTTLPALYVGVGGVIKSAIPYVGVGGVPKMAIPYIGVGGVPKL